MFIQKLIAYFDCYVASLRGLIQHAPPLGEVISFCVFYLHGKKILAQAATEGNIGGTDRHRGMSRDGLRPPLIIR